MKNTRKSYKGQLILLVALTLIAIVSWIFNLKDAPKEKINRQNMIKEQQNINQSENNQMIIPLFSGSKPIVVEGEYLYFLSLDSLYQYSSLQNEVKKVISTYNGDATFFKAGEVITSLKGFGITDDAFYYLVQLGIGNSIELEKRKNDCLFKIPKDGGDAVLVATIPRCNMVQLGDRFCFTLEEPLNQYLGIYNPKADETPHFIKLEDVFTESSNLGAYDGWIYYLGYENATSKKLMDFSLYRTSVSTLETQLLVSSYDMGQNVKEGVIVDDLFYYTRKSPAGKAVSIGMANLATGECTIIDNMEGQETFLYADEQWLYCAANENGYFQKVLLEDISRIEHAFLTPLEEGNQEIDQLFAESMGKNITENETEYRLPIYGMTDQIVVCGPSNILNLETQKGVTPQMYPEEYPRLLQVDDEMAWNKAEAVVLESIGANQVMGADGTIYYELGKE